MGGIYEVMKDTTEMDSIAMICIPTYIKHGSALQKLRRAIHRHTDVMVVP
jgi:hypothetical protein